MTSPLKRSDGLGALGADVVAAQIERGEARQRGSDGLGALVADVLAVQAERGGTLGSSLIEQSIEVERLGRLEFVGACHGQSP